MNASGQTICLLVTLQVGRAHHPAPGLRYAGQRDPSTDLTVQPRRCAGPRGRLARVGGVSWLSAVLPYEGYHGQAKTVATDYQLYRHGRRYDGRRTRLRASINPKLAAGFGSSS